jgi:hypothetical protein
VRIAAGLEHCPSGNFWANGAWLAICALAHNLMRWTAKIGSGINGIVVAKTQRNRLFDVPGRLTTHGRKKMLHLPENWPWAQEFLSALAKLRALPSG